MKKTILSILLLLEFINLAQAQVTSVLYLIEYNETSSLYDCKIVINSGKATTYIQRIQFNAQYTVVVPTGAQVTTDELHNPIESNQNYQGTIPCLWEQGPTSVSPDLQPENDFHTFFPNLSPPSAYNDLFVGDTITLFSLNIDVDPCDNSVRPFINGQDLDGNLPMGGDYSNGFTIGNVEQKYSGNLYTPYKNNVSLIDTLTICLNECLELKPNLPCIEEEDLYFEWSTGENADTIEVCPLESSNYYILVKDSLDTILDSLSVFIEVNTLELELNDLEICLGTNTLGTANISGGTWSSTNTAVAFIDTNTGVITGGDSPGEVKFKYLAPNGWSKLTETLIVHANPAIEIPDYICVGSQANISSNLEGVWSSSDPGIAYVYDIGVVEGIAEGLVSLTFTDTTSYCSATADIEILQEQIVTNTGSDTLCAIGSTILTPHSGGQWTISYMTGPDVATVQYDGLVTGLAEGKVVFSFNSDLPGCGVSDSDTIYVFDPPNVEFLGDDRICIGGTTSFPINEGVNWEVLHPTVASIDVNTGIITGLAQGATSITLTDPNTGCTATSSYMIVDPRPSVSVQSNSLCIGGTTEVNPSSGGIWTAVDPEIADLESTFVTGVSEGIAGFIFTSSATGCVSDTLFITVHPHPITNINGPSEICSGETTFLEPSSGGTWSMSDNYVATITNSGVVTGISSGKVTGTFIDSTTGCTSEPSDTITVLPSPFAGIFEQIKLCVGETLIFFPNTFVGFWESDNPEVATVDSMTGHITTLSEGVAYISFTDSLLGCFTSTIVKVFDSPAVSNLGESMLCIGENTSFSSSSDGTWVSSDPSISTIDISGDVAAKSEGTTTFIFTDSNTGCSSEPLTITVLPPSDPACIVGTKDIGSQNIKLYPNPAKDLINVESESLIESISIYSLEYQKLKEEVYENGKTRVQVATTDIISGLYLIALKTNGTTFYKKLIIE